jgi:hypothetical protein
VEEEDEKPTPSTVQTIHETQDMEETEGVTATAVAKIDEATVVAKIDELIVVAKIDEATVVSKINEEMTTYWTPGARMTRTIVTVLSEACITEEEGVRYHWMIGMDETGKDLERASLQDGHIDGGRFCRRWEKGGTRTYSS